MTESGHAGGAADIAALIVCYHPDAEKILRLLKSIEGAVGHIFVFNNGGFRPEMASTFGDDLTVLSVPEGNVGIGTALNQMAERAELAGFSLAISFDQDSEPVSGMIAALYRCLTSAGTDMGRVAAVGPRILDRRDSRVLSPVACEDLADPVRTLITSGCLFRLAAWRKFPFDEALFIDCVDFNWCWRVSRADYLVLQCRGAYLWHELSDQITKWCGLHLTRYQPVRRYYQCRNSAYHLIHFHMPWADRWFAFKRLLMTWISASLADPARLRSLSFCLRGTVHGVLRRLGRADALND